MKKFTIFIFTTFLLLTWVNAQVVVLNRTGDDITGENLVVDLDIETSYYKVEVFLQNNSANAVSVYMQKEEVELVDGSDNSFCWDGQCYDPSVMGVNGAIHIEAGASSTSDCFYTEFFPNGKAGTSVVRYHFVSELPGKSFEDVHVTITFNVTGENDITSAFNLTRNSKAELFNPSPNPANAFTSIRYNLPFESSSAQIVVRNLTGGVVKTKNLDVFEETVRLDTSGLSSGIYLYSLVVDNTVVDVKKLIVNK